MCASVCVWRGGITTLYKSTPSTINKQLGGEVISIISLSPSTPLQRKMGEKTHNDTHTNVYAHTQTLIPPQANV